MKLERAARTSVALDRLVGRYRLGAFAHDYESVESLTLSGHHRVDDSGLHAAD